MTERPAPSLPHASERVEAWRTARAEAGALLVGLDFDGTLAPIVEHADEARMPEETRHVLERLVARTDTHVAVISGRALRDIEVRVGVPGVICAGNHGLEVRGRGIERVHEEARAARPLLENASARLREELRDIAGAWVEDKGYTLSVHYRQVSEPRAEMRVRQRVTASIAGMEGLRCTEGRKVVEVRPAVIWDKGRALSWLIAQLELPAGAPRIFIGDDLTDEDAFRALEDHRGGVLVTPRPSRSTAAAAFVQTPDDVRQLLERLAT